MDTKHYAHLGSYSDIVEAAQRQQPLFPPAMPGVETQRLVREALGFCAGPEIPQAVRVERRWQHDGLAGEEISWSVGYGPRTQAYLLQPAGDHPPLPGVLALHDHGAYKFYGKEKIADGPEEASSEIKDFRKVPYGDRAFANALAKKGFIVLVHDVFLWGSRKFPLDVFPPMILTRAEAVIKSAPLLPGHTAEVSLYNDAAWEHEHLVQKYCNLLGTNHTGLVGYEDRVAVNYLLSRPEVISNGVGCVGLSGGGSRAAVLQATHDSIHAAVVVGMMSTYQDLLDRYVFNLMWMLFPYYLSRRMDWPDLTACRAPSPLMVQYCLDDHLFSKDGMHNAHHKIIAHYERMGKPEAYVGEFYPGDHRFDVEMQEAAFAWLGKSLT